MAQNEVLKIIGELRQFAEGLKWPADPETESKVCHALVEKLAMKYQDQMEDILEVINKYYGTY